MKRRVARASDADQIASVFLRSRKAYVMHAPLAHDDEDVRQWIREGVLATTSTYVAEADGGVVGFVSYAVREGTGWIEHLYVAPGHTRAGVGSALLKVALQNLPRTVHLYTFQGSTEARRFYERHGFKAVAFTEGAENEERCPDVLYKLEDTQPNHLGERASQPFLSWRFDKSS